MITGSTVPDYGEDRQKAADHLDNFLVSVQGSVLRAWLEVFDQNNDQRISKIEFSRGMRELGYTGDVFRLFGVLDDDDSNELTLDEIDMKQSTLWREFRKFATDTFKGAEDLIQTCYEMYSGALSPELLAQREDVNSRKQQVEGLDRKEFCSGIRKCGWPGGSADLNFLFDALHDINEERVKVSSLSWLGIEIKRVQKKQEAKTKSVKWQVVKSRKSISPQERRKQFDHFKAFLKKRYGNLIRGWRQALAPGDQMVLPKTQFLKGAVKLGFSKEAKELWKSLDKDDSGFASIDELDPANAETLAYFKEWMHENFGSIKSGFRMIDEDNTTFITVKEFHKALRHWDFPRNSKHLFNQLDRDGNGKLEIEDILFLEKWNPLPFLLVPPNYKAMNEVKKLLLIKTGRYMKAWRHLLDKDATNRCNWHEFEEACIILGYTGPQNDMPGAWRAFDEDLSGYITLREIDEESSNILLNFRKWAHEEFGGVKSLFQCFDADGSNSLTFQEFRAACRVYGYDGSTRILFSALDVDQEGTLSMKEVSFLDDWDLEDSDDEEEEEREVRRASQATEKPKQQQEEEKTAEEEEAEGPQSVMSSWLSKKDDPARIAAVARRKRELQARAAKALPQLNKPRAGHPRSLQGHLQQEAASRAMSSSLGLQWLTPRQKPTWQSTEWSHFGQDFLTPRSTQAKTSRPASAEDTVADELEAGAIHVGQEEADSLVDTVPSRAVYGSWLSQQVVGLVDGDGIDGYGSRPGSISLSGNFFDKQFPAKFFDAQLPPDSASSARSPRDRRPRGIACQSAQKPTLDELLQCPRVGPASLTETFSPSRKKALQIGSSFANAKAYYKI
eukprot:TRINITY_DN48327_c0_g1_i1.p1 TRINITY_DN48327_c0_g1~~TRINITY_DN48327_c0_g1_i1.p1  ORF type:complete len:843 (+),score=213.13 TRINITY_DN48327_c0_g1_i1:100-2628(+)